jgi:ketosteroid isomerase-like protein
MSSDLILRLFETVDARRWSALGEVFHPDVVYERPGYEPLRGFEAVKDFYVNRRVIARGRHIIEGMAIENECGACWGRFEGAKHDDTPIDERWADVYTFADGRIRTRRSHFFRPAV